MIKKILLFGLVMLLSVAAIGQNKRVRGNYAGPAYAGLAVVIDTLGYTVVDSSATPAIQTDSVFQGAMLQYDTTNGWESVDRAAVLGYKEYVALLTQTGTDAPVATVIYNDLGGTLVWSYTGVGVYTATLAAAFTLNKTTTAPQYNQRQLIAVDDQWVSFLYTSANTLTLSTFVGGVADNGVLQSYIVTIRVYN